MAKEYRTISKIAGPLVFVEKTGPVGYGELVNIALPDGTIKRGQVLDTSKDFVVVQVFEGTAGIDKSSGVTFLGETIKLAVSQDMLGRILDGSGDPIDGGPKIIPEDRMDIIGSAINPWARDSRRLVMARYSATKLVARQSAAGKVIASPRAAPRCRVFVLHAWRCTWMPMTSLGAWLASSCRVGTAGRVTVKVVPRLR